MADKTKKDKALDDLAELFRDKTFESVRADLRTLPVYVLVQLHDIVADAIGEGEARGVRSVQGSIRARDAANKPS